MRRSSMLVLGLLAVALPAGGAMGQNAPGDGASPSPLDAAAEWGLLGTWKIDCAAPASRSNGALAFVERNGQLVHERDFGDQQDASPVEDARVLDRNTFEVAVAFAPGQVRRWVLTRGSDGRVRVLRNCNAEGVACSILDGRLVHNKQPSVWQTRCE